MFSATQKLPEFSELKTGFSNLHILTTSLQFRCSTSPVPILEQLNSKFPVFMAIADQLPEPRIELHPALAPGSFPKG